MLLQRDGMFVKSGQPALEYACRGNTPLFVDLDNDGIDEAVVAFPGYGLFIWRNNATWTALHSVSPQRVSAGDIDGSGRPDLVIDFGSTYGIWTWRNDATWAPLHPLTGESIVLADRDSDGKDEVVIDFGIYGLWQYTNDSTWIQLHPISPDTVAAGRLH